VSKSIADLKGSFKEVYYDLVEYLRNDCDETVYEFDGSGFALHLAEEGKIETNSMDRHTAIMSLSAEVDEVLEWNYVDEYKAYIYGINVAFGAFGFGMVVEDVDTLEKMVELLEERFDEDWENSKLNMESHNLVVK